MLGGLSKFINAYGLIEYSRHYFNNWFSALIDYLRGCYFINVQFRNGLQLYLDRLVYEELINLSKSGLIRDFQVNPDGTCVLNGNVNCDINSDLETVMKLNKKGWRFSKSYYFKDFGGFIVRFRHLSTLSIIEIFEYGIYGVDIDGDIVDAGSNIGDSAIYFALRGRKACCGS